MTDDITPTDTLAADRPRRYATGDVECVDAIHSALGNDAFADYCVGTAMKYLWRWRRKGGVTDLRKCEDYLTWAMQAAEGRFEECRLAERRGRVRYRGLTSAGLVERAPAFRSLAEQTYRGDADDE